MRIHSIYTPARRQSGALFFFALLPFLTFWGGLMTSESSSSSRPALNFINALQMEPLHEAAWHSPE